MKMEQHYWVAWSQIKGVGPSRLKKIWHCFGSMERAWQASGQELGAVDGLGDKLIRLILAGRSPLDPERIYREHLEKNPQFWTPADPEYPKLLLEIPSPPPLLYYQGQVKLLENQGQIPAIAMVGTRHPSEHGKRWTARISQALAQVGFSIVSGMAQGVDGVAHSACLRTGGRTIAVLGTGIDQIYPASHRNLYNEILAQGLILSEYPAGTRPDRSHFPARNRIIAGLTRATLVMEAPSRSGSLITAHYAMDFNREVYALPNSPEQQAATGCLDLIRRGAGMILGETQLIEELGGLPQLDAASPQLSLSFPEPTVEPTPQPSTDFRQISPELLPLWQAIAPEPTAFDLIVVQSGMGADQVSATLLQWELEGFITQLPGMRYRRL
ncbi:DNA-protecting protein DprA [Picosynechococcus sp. PCC 11901]|uniref:DNA-processing protein DprA n=2 Tax=Picosynechococcus sp. PCC 11901 TaxID=2579791 RepID=UPI0010FC18FF|nr:DNA-processing protein DprA [Picosynechococcus sp. PCC 11901]QCS48334.1 DNA-protecting protein DprA [Picosynechococcus sp. PCC 11901]